MPRGLSFPFRFDPDTGGFATASGVRKIRATALNTTPPGVLGAEEQLSVPVEGP